MTKNKDEDTNYVPVARKITPLGLGYSFENWKNQGEEWKNSAPHQANFAYNSMVSTRKHQNKEIIRIRTGAELNISQKKDIQKMEKECLKSIPVEIEWGVKGLPSDIFFFEYKTKTENMEK